MKRSEYAMFVCMFSDEAMSVEEAAQRLGVNAARVRVLLGSGALDGEKLGRTWVVRADSVRRRERLGRHVGRQLTAENAWAALFLSSGEDVDWLPSNERYRLLRLLERDGIAWVAKRLFARGEATRFAGHTGIILRLAADSRLVASGVSAAAAHALELTAASEVDAYVRASDLSNLTASYALVVERSAAAANVTLRLVADHAWHLRGHIAPIAAVAVDLAEGSDPRSARIGARTLAELDEERRWEGLRRRPGRPRTADLDMPAVRGTDDQ